MFDEKVTAVIVCFVDIGRIDIITVLSKYTYKETGAQAFYICIL
jgi:hypothetical protein